MIILLHGTGDDNLKTENWIPWVAKVMEKYGEHCLTVPGVASSEHTKVASYAMSFTRKLPSGNASRAATPRRDFPELGNALRAAGGDELTPALNILTGKEKEFIIEAAKKQKSESQASAHGIKYRTAVVGAAALHYYRRIPDQHLRPIRIVGHSRGGATAVALHNFLTYYGIPCVHTLTLDPCHGADSVAAGVKYGAYFFGVGAIIGAGIGGIHRLARGTAGYKDYYHKIWTGALYNIPCEKEVGKSALTLTYRPPIEVGTGGDATVTNADKLPTIEHGHMGKLRTINESEKAAERLAIKNILQPIANGQRSGALKHLEDLTVACVRRDDAFDDRCHILGKLLDTLTDDQ